MLKKIVYTLLLSSIFYGCVDGDYNVHSTNNISHKILVDASHDGGTWWYPQGASNFSPSLPHQGKQLADLLRSKGFMVDELPSYTLINDSILRQYKKVITVCGYGNYQESELRAYEKFLTAKSSLFLISDHRTTASTDPLASRLGVDLSGAYFGNADRYASDPITNAATSFYYNAGSIVMNENTNPDIQVLGWLNNDPGLPIMGVLKHPFAKIFFIGDANGIEGLPQPLTNNIMAWLFQ